MSTPRVQTAPTSPPTSFPLQQKLLIGTFLTVSIAALIMGGLAIGAYYKALPESWEALQKLERLKGWSFVIGGAGVILLVSALSTLAWKVHKRPAAPPASTRPASAPPTSQTPSPAAPARPLPPLSDADCNEARRLLYQEQNFKKALSLLEGKALSPNQSGPLLALAISECAPLEVIECLVTDLSAQYLTNGRSLVQAAALVNCPQAIGPLLRHRAQYAVEGQRLPMNAAIEFGYIEVIRALRKAGIAITEEDRTQVRNHVSHSQNREFCDAVDILCPETRYEVHKAIKENRNGDAEVLLKDKDLSLLLSERCLFLEAALAAGNQDMVSRFCRKQVVTEAPRFKHKLLHTVIEGPPSMLHMVGGLLAFGADPNADRPLMAAIKATRAEAVDLLLSYGAKPTPEEFQEGASSTDAAIAKRFQSILGNNLNQAIDDKEEQKVKRLFTQLSDLNIDTLPCAQRAIEKTGTSYHQGIAAFFCSQYKGSRLLAQSAIDSFHSELLETLAPFDDEGKTYLLEYAICNPVPADEPAARILLNQGAIANFATYVRAKECENVLSPEIIKRIGLSLSDSEFRDAVDNAFFESNPNWGLLTELVGYGLTPWKQNVIKVRLKTYSSSVKPSQAFDKFKAAFASLPS